MTARWHFLKLPLDMIDDVRFAHWPEAELWILVSLMALAKQQEPPGVIRMTPADIAWRLRRPEALVRSTLERGAQTYLTPGGPPILVCDEQSLTVGPLEAPPSPYPSDRPEATRERKRRSRARQRDRRHEPVTSGHEAVTSPSRALPLERERESEQEGEQGPPRPPAMEDDPEVLPPQRGGPGLNGAIRHALRSLAWVNRAVEPNGPAEAETDPAVLARLRRVLAQGTPLAAFAECAATLVAQTRRPATVADVLAALPTWAARSTNRAPPATTTAPARAPTGKE